ncbi:hypothetical protein [Roseicyclus persicicus]|uniref:Uncharacterized protein n=1 Tax=Roseicyclus persicicus TaxID=2650661 RepID=A0A7X6GWY0_9RHOB|nr:hypothetical protein [Roseibacterium persicicum]NKX43833.1 hypothetical protein [Roseibacterium persicicum]
MKTTIIATLAALGSALPAAAQSLLTPVSVSVQRYDEIVSPNGNAGLSCCAPLVLESGPGADFYHVRMVFDAGFSETVDRISISSNDITLWLPGAAEGQRTVGRYDYVGVFEDGSPSIFARRPRDWPAETEQGFLEAVWLVPDGVTAATVHIGPADALLQVPIDLNVAPTQPVTPGQTLQVAVTGFGAEPALALTTRISGQDLAGRVVPTAGQALRLELTATPLMSTATDAQAGENRAFMQAESFALVGPDGLPLSYLGYETSDGVRTRWSISSSWTDQPRPSELTLYYLGAPTAGTWTVYYLQDPVAQFNLQ